MAPSQETTEPYNSNPKSNSSDLVSTKPNLPSGPAHGFDVMCFKCLGLGHLRKDCTGLVRCKRCFDYGHTSSFCLSKFHAQRRYRAISRSEGEGSVKKHLYSGDPVPLEPSVPPLSTATPSIPENHSEATMAN